jgi:ABC-type nitrate/sulfonate/bicarbonate transport system permease component
MTAVTKIVQWLGRWVVLAACVAAWQWWADHHHSVFFPPPSAIVAHMYHLWFSAPASHLWLTASADGNILPSLSRTGIGLGIAIAIGLPLGLALGRSAALSGYTEPLVHYGRSMVPVTLFVIFIALFKLGDQMEIAYITFGAIWPILVNTIDGARTVDPLQIETARVFHLSARQRVTRLILPASLPKFFAGLRISVALALVLMFIGEIYGGNNGIGYLTDYDYQNFDLPGLWSGIVLLGILGYLLNAIVLGVEHYVLAWHRGARRRTS